MILPLVVLIATKPRVEQLVNISLPSIQVQSHQPDLVVIVSDSKTLTNVEQTKIVTQLAPLPVLFLKNKNSPGAAGSWNTGIAALSAMYTEAYVAILDDDDCWMPNHLSLCMKHTHNRPDLVLSGIEARTVDRVLAINIPYNLKADDFLIRNPGWQGSNTFATLSLFNAVGGFTNGLVSSNDRDLAIRILACPDRNIAYTGKVSVIWHCQQLYDALSSPGSPQKRRGCAQFLMLHGYRMSESVMDEYFQVMEARFDLTRAEIEYEIEQLGSGNALILD